MSGVVTPWITEHNNQAMSSGLRYRFEYLKPARPTHSNKNILFAGDV